MVSVAHFPLNSIISTTSGRVYQFRIEESLDFGFIGAEPFVDGVAKLLTALEEQALSNVRVRRGDARDLVAQFADQSIDRAFILFPDPWPKTRHRKRRLVQADFVVELARVLKPGARLMATSFVENQVAVDFVGTHQQVVTLAER